MAKGKRAKEKVKRRKAAKRFKESKKSNEELKIERIVLRENASNLENVESKKKIKNKNGSRLKKEKNSKRGFNFNYLCIFFFVCVLIFSIYQIVMWAVDMKKSEEQHQELLSQVVVNVAGENENGDATFGGEEVVKIDFEKLLEINEDVVGWLMIDGTNINYPILQSYDNNYYLRRDINRHISKSGSIYMDYRNDSFSDRNTVLYGHNMKNGTMFAELEKIYNNELGNDVEIKIFIPEDIDSSSTVELAEGAEVSEKNDDFNNVKFYKVFSTYSIRPDAFNMNISINEALDYTKIDFVGADELKGDEQVLTLFTCTDSMAERIIVHAVLVEEN